MVEKQVPMTSNATGKTTLSFLFIAIFFFSYLIFFVFSSASLPSSPHSLFIVLFSSVSIYSSFFYFFTIIFNSYSLNNLSVEDTESYLGFF